MPEQISGVELAIFAGKLKSVCEEMGFVLCRSSLSPNIKDRLDFSCAIFDRDGGILAQAAHIPVHLGSMAFAMKSLVRSFSWNEGDVLVVNDPYQGGTHLPDITVVAPFYVKGKHFGFVASRAHHANVGSEKPGSMPLSSSLEEEGLVISPQKLFEKGFLNQSLAAKIRAIDPSASTDLPEDFIAQISANNAGIARLEDWLGSMRDEASYFQSKCSSLNEYGATLMHALIQRLPKGQACFEDELEDDGYASGPIKIKVSIECKEDSLQIDFSGTSPQVKGNLNCPESVSAAAVYYIFACLLPEYAPMCDGVFRHISLIVPKGCVVNAHEGAAVAAGNVETSMRIVDVVQGALLALGVEMPAASQGTMNNIAMGYEREDGAGRWDYYETIAGGMGGHSVGDGLSAVQCHMTNTLNTPVESLELHYPLRIEEYAIRSDSGGDGEHRGGDGVVRSYRFLEAAHVTLLTERRSVSPWSVHAGNGRPGLNLYNNQVLPSKVSLEVYENDTITIETPGGGGWSRAQ